MASFKVNKRLTVPIRIGLFIILAYTVGCQKEIEDPFFDLGKEFRLKTGEISSARNENLSIRILEIWDSRCPIGVVCFWQGEVTVRLEVHNGSPWEVTLRSVLQPSDTINHYVFTLIDVLPYPVHGIDVPDKEKTVRLQIKKL